MKHKKNSRLFFILILFIAIFYILPFLFVKFHKLDFAYTVLFSIAKNETRLNISNTEKVYKLYTYIHNKIQKPNSSFSKKK